jgi:hypothetical protein
MQVGQLLGTLNFMDFLERGHGAVEAGPNLLDKLQIAMARGEGPISVLPVLAGEREILTVSDASSQGPVSRHRHCYDRFPANIRTPAQDEKRRDTLAAAATISPSFSRRGREGDHSKERAAERDLMVLDIKVKLQGLWKRLINLSGAEDPLSSSEYGTIFGTYQPVFCSSFHEVLTVRKVDVVVKGAMGVGVLVVVIKWASEYLEL